MLTMCVEETGIRQSRVLAYPTARGSVTTQQAKDQYRAHANYLSRQIKKNRAHFECTVTLTEQYMKMVQAGHCPVRVQVLGLPYLRPRLSQNAQPSQCQPIKYLRSG